MSTHPVTARFAQAEGAASQVLEAERAALAEIEHCERQSLQLVADSRMHAALVRERAEARITRVRERMMATARIRQERICSELTALAGDAGVELTVLAPVDHAIARVVEELIGISESI